MTAPISIRYEDWKATVDAGNMIADQRNAALDRVDKLEAALIKIKELEDQFDSTDKLLLGFLLAMNIANEALEE